MRLNPDCPVDHDAAERAVGKLPGPIRRAVFFSVGGVSVGLGVIGIFLPLWPTTCFLLLAAWCFARSSPSAERWLYENPVFGKYIEDYRVRGIISHRARRNSVAVMWAFIGVSALLLVSRIWLVALLLVIAAAVTLHLYSIPTEARTPAAD